MKVLSVNAGSSSLKFQVYEMPEEKVLLKGLFERIGLDGSYTIRYNDEKIKKDLPLHDHEDAVKLLIDELFNYHIIESLDEIKGIGHRVVQGGDKYNHSVIVTDEVVQDIEDLIPLAPVHNGAHVLGIRAFQKLVPNATSIVVFDNAFHATMEEEQYLYPVPYEWYQNFGVRKYGFHGTSHKYIAHRISEIFGRNDLKIINCHIGNGGSLCAIQNGKCIDTSMGFTPAAGIMMGTRAGDIDTSFVPFVMERTGKTAAQIVDDLNKKSGLLGISGISGDFRDVLTEIEKGNERAILARNMYINRIVDYIARYYVELEGCDVLCFTAGVGENNAEIRAMILNKLSVLGFKLDAEANKVNGQEQKISADDSSFMAYVIPTDEELMIARETYSFID